MQLATNALRIPTYHCKKPVGNAEIKSILICIKCKGMQRNHVSSKALKKIRQNIFLDYKMSIVIRAQKSTRIARAKKLHVFG
ncbi:unnamed protein product [Brugia pahangi]|uniref:Ovule protein n=1 Tax=Brugia pahangi TaxID=6280 RepID=A0A0N4T2N7_BRUPA|nr:unnamed protein product [Brugia pahangi]